MNRFVSNFILGFFVLVLMAAYSFAKQPTVYSMLTQQRQTSVETTRTAAETNEENRRVVLPNGKTIAVKIADTQESQERGLSGVERLGDNDGMLFVFAQPGIHAMWMRDMKISIDMVWLDDQGKVVHFAASVPPATSPDNLITYQNDQPAKYVLEVPAGTVEAAQIKEGDRLALS